MWLNLVLVAAAGALVWCIVQHLLTQSVSRLDPPVRDALIRSYYAGKVVWITGASSGIGEGARHGT